MAVLIEKINATASQFDFFRLCYCLEHLGLLNNTYIRSSVNLGFPIAEVECMTIEQQQLQLTVNFFGLTGVNSPLPLNVNDLTQINTSWKEFLQILTSSLFKYFYQTWKKTHPIAQRQQNDNVYHNIVTRIHHGRTKNRFNILQWLENYFLGMPFLLRENKLSWKVHQFNTTINHQQLGVNGILGRRYIDANSTIEIIIGPISLEQCKMWLAREENYQQLQQFFNNQFDLRIKIKIDKNNKLTFGKDYLGWSSRI